MKCMLAEEAKVNLTDLSSGWIAERKMNGTRILYMDGHLVNRRDFCYDLQFPEVLSALKDVDADLDGEIVYVDPTTGIEDFGICVTRCGTQSTFKRNLLATRYPVEYMVFDALRTGNDDLRMKPLSERKEALSKLPLHGMVKKLEYTIDLKPMWEKAKAMQWEGIMLKNMASPYVSDRSSSWLKMKNLKVETLRFDAYEINNAGITLVDSSSGTRVQYAGKTAAEVKEEIDENGCTEQQVHYLYKTDDGHLFQPVIKAESKRRYE